MRVRYFSVLLAAICLGGCATTQTVPPQPSVQFGTQIADLEQRMGEQEKEIVDLKYEVKDLASRVEMQQVVGMEEKPVASKPRVEKKTVTSSSSSRSSSILRVNVDPEQVQQALRVAGVYEGKIDGKIGPKTKSAIKEFQRQHGLKADGVVGRKTWYEMELYLE